jgi:small-conductance mechanosensitive channel
VADLAAVVSRFTGSPLALAFVTLVVIAATDAGLRWWVRRRRRMDGAGTDVAPLTDTRKWITRTLSAVLHPLVLLLWLHGAYLAGLLLMAYVRQDAWRQPLTAAANALYGIALAVTLVWLLIRVGRLLEAALVALAKRADTSWDDFLLPVLGLAIRQTLPLLAIIMVAPVLSATPRLAEIVRNGTSLLLIGAVALALYQIVDGVARFVLTHHPLQVSDNLRARSIATQVLLLRKVAIVVLGIFTIASMLMVFDSVRQFGASILASAGIAGIVVGFAAQRSLATLLAGFQIAITQPVRVDDVVIVEDEWGRIEEMTLTYAVVRIWDERRLIVPITQFIEQPFQNWTHKSAQLLCAVVVYVDYTLPVDAVRAELTRILEASSFWDRRVNVLQVTDAKEHTVELRALASAADASLAWDLRCEIRERLITFIQKRLPHGLPRLRTSVEGMAPALAAAVPAASSDTASR